MSTCISRHGEYGEHTPTEGDPFACERCGVEDTDAVRAEVERLRDRLSIFQTSGCVWLLDRAESAEAVLAEVRAAVAEHPDPCPEVDSEAGISCGWKRAFRDVRAALEDPA